MTTFDESLTRGTMLENWAADRLRADRWSVIRLADQPPGDGHGPRLDGLNLPDLQVMKHGITLAVEVKGKTAATFGRLSEEWEHGIDRGSWDSCLEYDRRYMPTYLLIVEAGQSWAGRDAYVARVNTLGVRESAIGTRPLVYWPRSQMHHDWLGVLNRAVNQRLQGPARARRARQAAS